MISRMTVFNCTNPYEIRSAKNLCVYFHWKLWFHIRNLTTLSVGEKLPINRFKFIWETFYTLILFCTRNEKFRFSFLNFKNCKIKWKCVLCNEWILDLSLNLKYNLNVTNKSRWLLQQWHTDLLNEEG